MNYEHIICQRVMWAAVTRKPHASVRELAAMIGRCVSIAQKQLNHLRKAGYIEWDDGTMRSRRIIVPFHVAGDLADFRERETRKYQVAIRFLL